MTVSANGTSIMADLEGTPLSVIGISLSIGREGAGSAAFTGTTIVSVIGTHDRLLLVSGLSREPGL